MAGDKLRRFYELLVNPLGISLMFLLMVVTVYSVVRRYFFKNPDLWAFAISYWVFGIMFLLGCGYAIYYSVHTGVDILYKKASTKGKILLELLTHLSYLIPAIVLLPYAFRFAFRSTIIGETDATIPVISPPIWWYKWILVASLVLVIPISILSLVKSVKEVRKQGNINDKQ